MLFPWLFCLASLPTLFTVKGKIAIPLPALARCRWWPEQTLWNPSHFHQAWVKLGPGRYRHPLSVCRISAPIISILSCHSPLGAHRCILKILGAVVSAVVSCGYPQEQGLDQVLCIREWQSKPPLQPRLALCLYPACRSSAAREGQAVKSHLSSQSRWSRKTLWCSQVGKQSARESLPVQNKARSEQGSPCFYSWPSALLSADTFRVFLCVNCRYI